MTLIVESLDKIKPAESLRLAKREARKKRNCSDSSGNSPAKILADGVRPIRVYLPIMPYLYTGCLVQGTVRLRSTGGEHSVCERSVCTLSGTSIAVMWDDFITGE